MTLDIDKMEAAAKAATQGEWSLNYPNPTEYFKGYMNGEGEFVELNVGNHLGFGLLVWRMEDDEVSPKCQANATHIATANPQAVLELVTRLREAEHDAHCFHIEYGDLHDSYEHLKNKCAELEGKLREAEKDAARYRWLRDVENQLIESDPAVSDDSFNTFFDVDLDEVIDGLIVRNFTMKDLA